MIRYGKQHIDHQDQKAVLETLKSELITQGPKIELFEKLLKSKFGSKYCSAVSSGTAALHLTGLALGWKKNDIILCSPISFLAASNAVIYSGAKPEFVDINPKDYNIDINELKKKKKFFKKKKKIVKAIIATDFAGNPCDWKELKSLSIKYNIRLINDNCHAIGAKYENNIKYAAKFADVVTHSYHPVKNITSGEGGAVLTNNKFIDNKIKLLRSHGTTKKTKNSSKPWYYEMIELGYNYRISDLHCALGISQLKKIEKFVKRRIQIAKIYKSLFSNYKNVITTEEKKKNRHAYHLYPVLFNFDKIGISKSIFFKKLIKKNIFLQVHYIPIYSQPFYKKNFNFKSKNFPMAERFYKQEVSLPMYYSLKNKQIRYIFNTIVKTLKLKKNEIKK